MTDTVEKTERKPGRPRSTASRDAILAATRGILENQSVREMSIEGIAREAGVGKTTIYRWWPSKTAIVLDAVGDRLTVPETDGGKKPGKTLAKHVLSLMDLFAGPQGRLAADLMAEGDNDPEARKALDAAFLDPLRQMTATLVTMAQESGDVDPALAPETAQDLIYGPVMARLVMGGTPPSAAEAQSIADRVMIALKPAGKATARHATPKKADPKKAEKKGDKKKTDKDKDKDKKKKK
ncbi:MAG: TetR/AcrR family transcriptional regulator [Alphaproteobacteria bacterium]|nr:TetR/AcrR family transcriptional regulator [Alphaproteobacteria bacterium]